jgi:DNA-binding response OmpR family regulator
MGWVLVVEDEAAARDVMCETLDIAGYQAVGATDGSVARQLLEARDAPPCVIVLDLMMPRMNGWQFREWQRTTRFASVPVVILSAVRDLANEAKKLLSADYLAKPIAFDALLEKVEKHCGPCAT